MKSAKFDSQFAPQSHKRQGNFKPKSKGLKRRKAYQPPSLAIPKKKHSEPIEKKHARLENIHVLSDSGSQEVNSTPDKGDKYPQYKYSQGKAIQ